MKIFVSSTYLDLKEYRDKVNEVIEYSGNQFVGMEVFQSHTHEPVKFCPEKVEDCDALVLIVAYRYGNIPDGQTISITQLEYEHALRNKIPVRIYLTDPEHPWPPKLIDENRETIDRFRNLLSKKHTRSYFTTAESLYEKLENDIKEFPIRPYIAHPYALQENFTGRKKEREMLTDWLKREPHPMLSVVAIGGMGKTALAWYWLMEDIAGSDEQPKKILWWSFYDQESSFEKFLKKAIEYYPDGEIDWNKLASTRDKMEFLYKILSENRYLLVLDGVERVLRAYYNLGSPYQGDEIKEDERGDFRSCIEPNCGMFFQWLASGYPRTKTLLTSRLYPKDLDCLDGCLQKDLEQMDKEDAVEFFYRQGVKGTRAEIEIACESVGYLPLSLRLLSGMIACDPKNPRDINEWMKYDLIPELKGKEGHNILELAYNSLDKKKQEFISKLSAFRNPMDWEAIVIFNEFGGEGKLNKILIELVDRGILLRDKKSNKFDLHPLVRKYCYDRLRFKERVHAELVDYFAVIPEPEKIEAVDDLAPVIELYFHTVRTGRYDEAAELYRARLSEQLYYRFGAYQMIIELRCALFPDGEDKLPRLKDEAVQAWNLSGLANSYAFSGQPSRAVALYMASIEICEKRGDKVNVAVGLMALASRIQIPIGELDSAEFNLRRSIEICNEVKHEFQEAANHAELWRRLLFQEAANQAELWRRLIFEEASDHAELGLLLIYRGKFEESENEFITALDLFTKLNEEVQYVGIVWAYRSYRALLMSLAEEALELSRKARELVDAEKFENAIIMAEYILGATCLMKGNLHEAEKHLNEALIRDRRINLVEFEPDILLELAKIRFKQNRKPEALKLAHEAMQIADRCEYRLKQADIHNFLSEFYLDEGDLSKAREHGEIAKERAGCGYVPSLERAEKLLEIINSKS